MKLEDLKVKKGYADIEEIKTKLMPSRLDRLREGLSDRNLAEVSRRIGVTRAHLSLIVLGKRNPGPELFLKLEGYLGGFE